MLASEVSIYPFCLFKPRSHAVLHKTQLPPVLVPDNRSGHSGVHLPRLGVCCQGEMQPFTLELLVSLAACESAWHGQLGHA